ncbi:hypothetical protein RND81_08G060100 [Saponaria officinalis]|uniref:Heme-binding-like protein At3g10130, chloroplastic n=1 Tax=Saponaria officinalis TaxID=3572 RepID=A0AAW1J432_SAPOF
MAIKSHLSHQISRPISTISPKLSSNSPTIAFPPSFLNYPHNKITKKPQICKCVVKQSLKVEESTQSSKIDVKKLVEFLYEDLPHLFDDQGINQTAYDERVRFRDPITKHDTISGYLFNISFLKLIFRPHFLLHWVKQDYWDSIKANDYFSLEGLWEVFKQLRMYKTPDLETPKYQILKRAADYEVRKYDPFVVVETQGDKLSGSAGFNSIAGYIFGKNSKEEKIPMTTPVFTETNDPDDPKVAIQIVIPQDKNLNSLPNPSQEAISLREVEGRILAALKFSGKPTEEVVKEKESQLRDSLIRDGLRPRKGCLLARYNDPGRTWDFIMRNEVLIWLEDFSLD